MRPLIVVVDSQRTTLPPDCQERFRWMQDRTVDEVAQTSMPSVANDYILEYIFREVMGYRSISDAVYETLRARLIADWNNDNPKTMMCSAQKGMLTITADGDIEVDWTKNAGPFYCQSALLIERLAQDKLQRVAGNS